MRGPSWENLDAFLQLDSSGGFATPAVVHFDLNAQLGEYESDTSEPRISGKEVDMVGISRGDEVEVAGERFDVMTSPQADGTGWALVTMARQGNHHAAV